ncbi:hypothetical protein Pmani_011723 [Petrolisthes manimaculis]|uniref:Uncharacterized protein n=1 Tax=Petrolisthes manimaculis TaxID=1843537 RepID=A0AAE1Q0J4_9EUCA|nr:hypothetical protein Pmani_011723 [Petrolisthes manimaculis]
MGAGFLSVKKWLLRKKHQIELARKRGWKGYWVCLKGTTLLFYPCDSREGRSVEAAPKHLIIVDGAIMQPIPEHPKRDYIFCLSTAFGDAYLFQAPCQVELENWVNSIHSACAAAFARHRGKTGTLHLLQEEIFRIDRAIESDSKLKHMAELQLSVVSDAESKQQIMGQIMQWEENLERLHCEQFRLRCYMASLQTGELPNPKGLLTHVSRTTKTVLNRLGVFTVSSFHAYICARSPSLLNNLLAGRGATKRRAPMLSRSNSVSSRRSLQMHQQMEGEKQYKVNLPDNQTVSISLKDSMTVEEFLVAACGRKSLNPMEHFVRVKKRRELEETNYFVPHRTDLIENYLATHEVVEICGKILYQVELSRSSLDHMWGFSVEAELIENSERQDELCCYISRVEDRSTAMQNAQVSPLQDQASPLGRDEPYLTTRAHDGLARDIARREEIHPPYSVVGYGAQTYDPVMIKNSRVLLTEPGSSSNDYHHATLSAGIIKGDEIMVINGAIVSDLDMMYIESVLQEELALCLMMRSSRAELPLCHQRSNFWSSRTDPPDLASLMKTTDEIIESLVCPPPPSEISLNEEMISRMIVPAPSWSKSLGPAGRSSSDERPLKHIPRSSSGSSCLPVSPCFPASPLCKAQKEEVQAQTTHTSLRLPVSSCLPLTPLCQEKKDKETHIETQSSCSDWRTKSNVESPPITRDLVVIHLPLLTDSTVNLTSVGRTSSAAASNIVVTTATTCTNAVHQSNHTSPVAATVKFPTSLTEKKNIRTSAKTAGTRRYSLPCESQLNKAAIQSSIYDDDEMVSWKEFMKSRLKCKMAAVQRHSLHLCNSSESDILSPTTKCLLTPSSDSSGVHHQCCCDKLSQTANMIPLKLTKRLSSQLSGFPSKKSERVPCHAIYCAYSTTPEALSLQAKLRESLGISSHRNQKTPASVNPFLDCCSTSNLISLLSEYRPKSRLAWATELHRCRQKAAGVRASCLLCQRPWETNAQALPHLQARHTLHSFMETLCRILSQPLPHLHI